MKAKNHPRPLPVIAAIVLLLVFAPIFVPATPSFALSSVFQPDDVSELEAFLDGVMAAKMAENHVAGAVIAVVKDGELFFSKGYGYSDVESRLPVDPEQTLFRPGSTTKLFTWSSVMQLVEQGSLSLDEDINFYLDFDIPETYSEPITLRNLLTHTPGFEDRGEGLFLLDPDEVVPLGEYLRTYMPARVFPPGELGAYSNYGTALAGYIVSRVSGIPFEEYVERNIFETLGMENSTFRQPLPPEMAPQMSGGYNFVQGEFIEGGFEYVQAYPAGSLSATAEDMAKFMIAHLQNGHYQGSRILEEETAELMHSQLFSHDPRLNGNAHGFFESTVNSKRVIGHGGDTLLFHTGLFLVLEENLGFYLSTNSVGGGGVPDAVFQAFMDRYYPVEEQLNLMPSEEFRERIDPYQGEYLLARSSFTTFEKFLGLLMPISARLNGDGYLVVSAMGQVHQYVEVKPGLLVARDDPDDRLVFTADEDGQRYLLPEVPFAFIQKPWYATTMFQGVLFLSIFLLFTGTLIGWPLSALAERGRRDRMPQLARLARWTAAAFGLLFLVFIILLIGTVGNIDPAYGVPTIFFGDAPLLSVSMALPPILALVGLIMLVFTIVAWVRGFWRGTGRIHYTLLTIAALALLWVLWYWNLLF